MAAFSAKNARVSLNGTFLTATKWSVNYKADQLDISNFETTPANNQYADYTAGLQEAEVSVDAIWDANLDPFTTAPTVIPTTVLTNVRLYLDRVNLANYWSFPSMVVFDATTDAEVRGIVRYTFRAMAKGTFVVP